MVCRHSLFSPPEQWFGVVWLVSIFANYLQAIMAPTEGPSILLRLPVEIWHEIFERLDKKTQLSIRLTCKELESLTLTRFRMLYFIKRLADATPTSINQLQDIMAHPHLGSSVRTLTITGAYASCTSARNQKDLSLRTGIAFDLRSVIRTSLASITIDTIVLDFAQGNARWSSVLELLSTLPSLTYSLVYRPKYKYEVMAKGDLSSFDRHHCKLIPYVQNSVHRGEYELKLLFPHNKQVFAAKGHNV